MSDVLAFVKGKTVLITGLTNVHVVRTAEMLDIHCIVFARGKVPGGDVLQEAEDIGIVVLTTRHTTFTTCGLLYEGLVIASGQQRTLAALGRSLQGARGCLEAKHGGIYAGGRV
jgi:hypothetical protein